MFISSKIFTSIKIFSSKEIMRASQKNIYTGLHYARFAEKYLHPVKCLHPNNYARFAEKYLHQKKLCALRCKIFTSKEIMRASL